MRNSTNPTYTYVSLLNRTFRALRWLAFLGAALWIPSTQAATRAVRENSVEDNSEHFPIVEYNVASSDDIQQEFSTTSPLTQQAWQQESQVADNTIALAEISWLYLADSHGEGMRLSSDGKIAYVTNANGLAIIDVNDKFNPTIMSTLSTGEPMFDVELLDENWVCATNTFNGFLIINVTDPAKPILTTKLPLSETEVAYFLDVSTDRNTVYVNTNTGTLFFIDVQEKENPQILASLPTVGVRLKRSLDGRYLYTADGGTLFKVIDVSDPRHPTLVGSLTLADGTGQIARGPDGHTIILCQHSQTRAIDVRNPHAPVALPNPLSIVFHRMLTSIEEKLGYAASQTGAYIVDLQDPKHLRVVGELNRRNEPSTDIVLSSDKKSLYLGVRSGFSVAEIIRKPFLPALLTKRARIPTMPDGGVEDILLTPDERIAYLRLNWPGSFSIGFIVIDVSDPSAPKRITKYSVPNTSFDHWALSENAQLLYTADHRWLQFRIVDVSVPSQPRIRGIYPISQEGKVFLIPARNIVYIIHKRAESKEVIILDVSNPDNPIKMGDYLPETDIHSIESSSHGERIFISGKKGLDIADIAGNNITDPKIIGRYRSAGEADVFKLSPDNQKVYARFTTTMSIQIIDVVDPENMRYVAEIQPSGTGMFSELGKVRLTRDGHAYIELVYGFGLYDVSGETPRLKAFIALPGAVKRVVPMTNHPYALVAARTDGVHSIQVQNPAPLVAYPHPTSEQQVIKVDQSFKKQFIIYHGNTLQEATDGDFSLTAVQMSQAFEPEALPYWLTFATSSFPSDTFPPINSRPQFAGVPIRMPKPLVIAMSAKDHHGKLLMQQLITLEIQSSLTLTVNSTSLNITSPANVVGMTITLSDRESGAFIPHQKGSVAADFNPKKGQFSALGSVLDLNDMLTESRFSTVKQGNHTATIQLDDGINNLLTRQISLEVFRKNRAPRAEGNIIMASATTSTHYSCHVQNFFKDPDGDPLHYSYSTEGSSGTLSWLNLDPKMGVFSGTPPVTEVGTIELNLTVTDGYKSLHTSIKLKVNISLLDLLEKVLTYGGPIISALGVIWAAYKYQQPLKRDIKAGCCRYYSNKLTSCLFRQPEKKWIQEDVSQKEKNTLKQLEQQRDQLAMSLSRLKFQKNGGSLKLLDHHRQKQKVREEIEQLDQQLQFIHSSQSAAIPLIEQSNDSDSVDSYHKL